jgi:plasmid stability protein
MPVLHVEAVPTDLYERIQQRAAARNHEFAAEVLHLLERGLSEEDALVLHAAALADLQSRRWTPPPGSPDSTVLLREDRDR